MLMSLSADSIIINERNYFSSFPLLRDEVALESIISSDIHKKNVGYGEDPCKKRYARGMYDGVLYLFDDKIRRILQQFSAFKRRSGIGKYYQQRHTQKKRKDNDSVAFGTANNIVCGKESRRAKP